MEIVKMLTSSWPWIFAIIVMAIIVMAIIVRLINSAKKTEKKSEEKTSQYEYKKKNLVTEHELKFYKELKQIVDKNRMTILTKVRLWDIIEPKNKGDTTAKNKISQKHVDFVLCDSVKLTPLLVIELDDSTHNRDKNKKRDEDKNKALKSAGLPILRTYSASNLEEEINKKLAQKTAAKKA